MGTRVGSQGTEYRSTDGCRAASPQAVGVQLEVGTSIARESPRHARGGKSCRLSLVGSGHAGKGMFAGYT